MKIVVKPKIWGNSLGIVIPRDIVKRAKITPETEIVVIIERENPIKELFGSLRGWKIDAQKMKDDIRREEFEAEKRKWKKLNTF
ncbi:MAG: hypothetical protein AABX10_02170 [Nanoarchaeota archaeon]